MQIADLRKVLSSFEELLGHAQVSKGTIADLARLRECLGAFDHLTVTQFCKACEQIGATAGSGGKSGPDEQTINAYTEKLHGVGDDRAKFDEVIQELSHDKTVRIAELSEVARRFVGGTKKYAKKNDALREIKLRFEAHIKANRRLSAASDIF